MRRRIVAVGLTVGALVAGCGGGGGGPGEGATPSTSSSTTAAPTTTVAATTTTLPPTTVPPTTTTTVVTDATTADPKVLATQLQGVLDRYQALYLASRTDPNRPFVDQKLHDDFTQVAEHDLLARLILRWEKQRDEGSAVRPGSEPDGGPFLTSLQAVSPDSVMTGYCLYDDGITYSAGDGVILNDSVVIKRGTIAFELRNGTWRLASYTQTQSEGVAAGSPNPCPAERTP